MADPSLLPLLYLLSGLLLGLFAASLFFRFRIGTRMMDRDAVAKSYVAREIHDQALADLEQLRADLRRKEENIARLTGERAALLRDKEHLQTRDKERLESFESLRRQARFEFETIANRLLEEKSKTFTAQNQKQIGDILTPLRDQLLTFENGLQKRFVEETRDRISLKKEIESLHSLNAQLSADANNLASALKGNQKLQGDWGELQLEILLQRSGLEKGVHYRTQASFRDVNGSLRRPDFIIHLPEEKHLVIDSKVSLTAYERFHNAESDAERTGSLREHVASLRRHVRGLGAKNYQELYQINSPDYLLLFVPIEPALTLAIREDEGLFVEALEQNIVLVSTSTLLATLRTVSFIWKQEKQKRSVQEIARQGGLLYDKFCLFIDDMKDIGLRLDQLQASYNGAMNKLSDSKQFGSTLIGRAERIRKLGARTRKRLPTDLLEEE